MEDTAPAIPSSWWGILIFSGPERHDEMKAIAGYQILGLIDEAPGASFYRAVQVSSQLPVIITIINVIHRSQSEIARIKHEYDLIRRIDVDEIVKIRDIIADNEWIALVLEDFGGIALKHSLTGALPLARFLEIAIQATAIIKALHIRNIIHRDLKPANMLYSARTGTLKITGFGIARELNELKDRIYDPQVIEGTLAYISPEQTGRMNCGVDYRTDFYSLGITFYELLTGRIPFQSREPMQLIHAHIARPPIPPHHLNPQIPTVVGDIVLRLLEKSPEERYQSGQGLLSDLIECRDRLAQTGGIDAFDIGKRDISPKFNLPQMLVGREKELKILFQTVAQVSSGASRFLLLAGEPGIGKSALANNIHKQIVSRGGYFVSGKYDPLRQSVPYSAIIQAGQAIIRLMLAEREERIRSWEEKLLAAMGPNGRIISDMIPEIELLIGRQPQIPDLAPEEAQNRFKLVLKSFFRILAEQEHPLVLFLDDLQWADPASLELIQALALDRGLHHFFMIAAYRDNEVAAHLPLMLTLDAIRAGGAPLQELSLKALNKADVTSLLTNFLRCDEIAVAPLANNIHAKTLGNPFFVNQFLKRLYENRHLIPDPTLGWQWDMAAINKMQVTDNVIEFMVEKLLDLPPEPLALVKIGACIGNRFEADILAAICGRSIDDMLYPMDTLLHEGLVTFKGGLYRFHHDRIHEAAYSLLLPAEQEQLHYRIGRMKLENTRPEDLFNHVFYIADQLNKAHRLLAAPEERRQAAELNLMAGIKAKDATAYEAAVNYLKAGIDLLVQDAWQSDYRLTFDLHLEQMECQYLARNFDEAQTLFEIVIANASGRTDIARTYNIMIILYTNMRGPEEAIRLGMKALRLFGIRLSIKMGPLPVLIELIKVSLKLRRIRPEGIPALPVDRDEERAAYQDLMLSIGTPGYYVNPNIFAYMALRCVNETLTYGHQANSAIVFISLATIVQKIWGDYELGYRIGKMALELNQKLDNRKIAGHLHHMFAFFVQHWKKHAREDVTVYRQVYQLCLNSGNFIYAGHSITAATYCRLMTGEPLDHLLADVEKYREFMRLVKDPLIGERYQENLQMIRALKGLTPDRCSMSGDEFDEIRHLQTMRRENNVHGICFSLLYKLKLLYLYGRHEEALREAESLEKHIKKAMGTLVVPEHYFYYCMILAALLPGASAIKKVKYLVAIRSHQSRMAKWAGLCPENYRHKYDLIQAEVMAARGRWPTALRLYAAAIRNARQNGYINEEALACERLALQYQDMGARDEASIFVQRAYHCYGQWGALAKQSEIKERWAEFMPAGANPASADGSQHNCTIEASKLLDLSTVMQFSQAISGEIRLERLLYNTMHLSLTNAGAQRGFLILPQDGGLSIEAAEDLDREGHYYKTPMPLEQCPDLSHAIVHYVSRSRESIILAHAATEGLFVNDPYVARNRCKSILCMPLLNKGNLSAILYIENNLTANAFTPERKEILGIIAAQAAISLENARLFELATLDGMTKLYVHRYFQLLLEKEIERSRRYNRPLALVMIDIDNFKLFNDTYGHPVGDEVLKGVARILREKIRSVDMAARYGGEEFVLILPETDAAQALSVCEKVRRWVEEMRIPHHGNHLQVTISLGVSMFPDHALDKQGLITSADEALYSSKRLGKNRVTAGQSFPHLN